MEAAANTWTQEQIDAATIVYVSVYVPHLVRSVAAILRTEWRTASDAEIERILTVLKDMTPPQSYYTALSMARRTVYAGRVTQLTETMQESLPLVPTESAPWEHKQAAAEAAEQRREQQDARLRAAIEQLSPDKQELIEMVEATGSIAEAAELLGISSYRTAVSRHQAAQRDIKRFMARDGQRNAAADDAPINSPLAAALQSGAQAMTPRSAGKIPQEIAQAMGGESDNGAPRVLALTIHKGKPERARHDRYTRSTDVADTEVTGAEHAAKRRLASQLPPEAAAMERLRMRVSIAELLTLREEQSNDVVTGDSADGARAAAAAATEGS